MYIYIYIERERYRYRYRYGYVWRSSPSCMRMPRRRRRLLRVERGWPERRRATTAPRTQPLTFVKLFFLIYFT